MIRVQNPDLEIKRAAQLSITEISLGSLGHAFKIPLTGQVLSLNQLAFMLNAINKDQLVISSAFEISSISAVLKSFSPAGQKLGPMLSIAMQGFLFWVSCVVTRAHLVGQIIGAILMALWSFVQPLISYFIIYGFTLIQVAQYYEKKMKGDYSFLHDSLFIAMGIVFALKILIAVGLTIYSYITKKEIRLIREDRFRNLSRPLAEKSELSPWQAALRDLLRPLFLLSFILMLIFIWQLESSWSQKIWMGLRPLAVACALFYLLRSPFISKKLEIFAKKSPRFERIYSKAKATLALITQQYPNKQP